MWLSLFRNESIPQEMKHISTTNQCVITNVSCTSNHLVIIVKMWLENTCNGTRTTNSKYVKFESVIVIFSCIAKEQALVESNLKPVTYFINSLDIRCHHLCKNVLIGESNGHLIFHHTIICGGGSREALFQLYRAPHMTLIFSSMYGSVWHNFVIASTWRWFLPTFLGNAAPRLQIANSAMKSCAWGLGIPQSQLVCTTHWWVYMLWYPDKISLWAISSN